jgi:UDP-N-acetylglucosamine--N-acetylmuramyl-(pentapeptide) pyrophosphoryl-undecaprenol N-acetylglucosamine transferase
MLPAGLWDSEKIMRRHNFSAAFGVGGYASGPMILLARMHGVPSVIFEPNVEPGFTNRVLAGISTRVACGFQETANRFGTKAVATGIPVRRNFSPRRATSIASRSASLLPAVAAVRCPSIAR